jgi:hypothetical protein
MNKKYFPTTLPSWPPSKSSAGINQQSNTVSLPGAVVTVIDNTLYCAFDRRSNSYYCGS